MENFWDVTHALWWHVCHTPMCIIAIMAREAWWVAAKRASQLRFYSQWKLQNATSCRMPYTAQCTMHNAHVIIPITCTHWQLYICCCKSGHFCQLNCVAVGDGADYGSCWVWLWQKGGSRGEQLLQYSSTLTFTNFDFQNNLCNIVRNILHSILSF